MWTKKRTGLDDFILSLNNYLLGTRYGAGTVLGDADITVSRQTPHPHEDEE